MTTDVRLSNTALTAWEKAVAEHTEAPPRRTEDDATGDQWVIDGIAAYRVHAEDEIGLNRIRVLPEAIHETVIVPLLPGARMTYEAEASFLCREAGVWLLIVPLEDGTDPVWVSRQKIKVLAPRGLSGWTVRLLAPTLRPLTDGESPHASPVLFWGPGDDPSTDEPRMIVAPIKQSWDEYQGTKAIAAAWLEHYRPKGGRDGDTDDEDGHLPGGATGVEISVPGHEPVRFTGRQFDDAVRGITRTPAGSLSEGRS